MISAKCFFFWAGLIILILQMQRATIVTDERTAKTIGEEDGPKALVTCGGAGLTHHPLECVMP